MALMSAAQRSRYTQRVGTSATTVALAVLLAGCHHDAPRPRPPEELLGIPVQDARVWATAIAPNNRGGWNFITQSYELGSGKPTEFVVLDLQTGHSRIFEGPADIYTNSNYQFAEQLRAPNGRIFFPEIDGHLAYYEPRDETVKQLGRVVDAKGEAIYRMVFGPDGILYGGTQSNGLPTIFELDPETLRIRILGRVGQHRVGYSYAYYLAADPPWLYIAVGEDPWELVAFDTRSGSSRILATRGGDGFMQLDARPTGLTATLISRLRTPAQKTEIVRLVDGAIEVTRMLNVASQTKPRSVLPRTGALTARPELDLSRVTPDANGVGYVRWRLSRTLPWRDVTFRVRNTSPIPIESLTPLPDGTILGNARQYHGFFQFDPKTRSFRSFGKFEVSGGPRTLFNGRVYISGYPNSALYAFDPTRPWSRANPVRLGAFSAGAHYPYFLVPSANGRLYYAGRRERTGVGSAVGYYDTQRQTFAGHHDRLEELDPQGMVVLDDLNRVVLSGRLNGTASRETLIVYDRDLRELERLVVRPGLRSSGLLFATKRPGVVLGISALDGVIYRYDVIKHAVVDWRAMTAPIGPSAAKADGTIWVTIGSTLVRIDDVFNFREVRQLKVVPATGDALTWQNDRLYWAHGAELRAVNLHVTER